MQGVRGSVFFNTLVTMWSSLIEREHSKVSAASTSRNARWDRVRCDSKIRVLKGHFLFMMFFTSVGVPYKSLLRVPVIFRYCVINWPQKSTQRFDQTVNFNAASPRPWNDNGNKKPWRQNRNARGGGNFIPPGGFW